MREVLYAVIKSDGSFSRAGDGRLRIYQSQKRAEKWAYQDGDSVVELIWDTDKQPLFIRRKVVE